MSTSEHLALFLLTYLLTGISLVGRDLAAPPLERKGYVLQKNTRVAVITWFVWPVTAFLEVIEEKRLGRNYLRFGLGILLLALGLYLWARFIYLGGLWLIGTSWIAFVLTAIAMLVACPAITAIAMPPHAAPSVK